MIASDHGFRWKEGRPVDGLRAPPPRPPAGGTATRGSISSGGRGSRPTANRGHGEVGAGLPPRSWPSSACRRATASPARPCRGVAAVHAALADYRAHYRPGPRGPQADEQGERRGGRQAPLPGLSRVQAGRPPAARRGADDPHRRLLQQRGPPPPRARREGPRPPRPSSGPRRRSPERLGAVEPERPAPLPAARPRPLGRPAGARRWPPGSPKAVDYAVGRTVAYARGGEAERGLRLLGSALAARPEDPRLHLLRGRYRLERHQLREGPGRLRGRAPARIRATPSPSPPRASPVSASATPTAPPAASGVARDRSRSAGDPGCAEGVEGDVGKRCRRKRQPPSFPPPVPPTRPPTGRGTLRRRDF